MGLATDRERRSTVEDHLDELARLVETAGGVAVERVIQERSAPDPATLVGSGLLDGLADTCRDLEVSSVVFDEDLTGAQARNVEKRLPKEVKVLDRPTMDEITTVPIPAAHGIDISKTGRYVYVTNITGGGTAALYTLDTRTNTLVGTPTRGCSPAMITIMKARTV